MNVIINTFYGLGLDWTGCMLVCEAWAFAGAGEVDNI